MERRLFMVLAPALVAPAISAAGFAARRSLQGTKGTLSEPEVVRARC